MAAIFRYPLLPFLHAPAFAHRDDYTSRVKTASATEAA